MKRSFALKNGLIFLLAFCLIVSMSFAGAGYAFAAEGDETAEEFTPPDNGIPVVYLNIDESNVTIEEMHSDPEHNTKCTGTFTLDVPDGFT